MNVYLCGITSITFSSIIIHVNHFNWSQRFPRFTSKIAPWPVLNLTGLNGAEMQMIRLRIIARCLTKIIIRWARLQTEVTWETKEKENETWNEASL